MKTRLTVVWEERLNFTLGMRNLTVAIGKGQKRVWSYKKSARPPDHPVEQTLNVEEAWEIAQRRGVPLIVDAAAEEDIHKYVKCSDIAIYSGSKAIEGPTSGIVAGRRTYVEWLKVQLHGIGRSMKVGKETAFGLLQALDEYIVKEDRSEQEKAVLQTLLTLNEVPGVKVTIVQDEAGRAIYRGRVHLDQEQTGINAVTAVEKLREGDIAIYTRDYGARQGYFDIDPRPLLGDDIQVIQSEIYKLAGGK